MRGTPEIGLGDIYTPTMDPAAMARIIDAIAAISPPDLAAPAEPAYRFGPQTVGSARGNLAAARDAARRGDLSIALLALQEFVATVRGHLTYRLVGADPPRDREQTARVLAFSGFRPDAPDLETAAGAVHGLFEAARGAQAAREYVRAVERVVREVEATQD